MESRNKFLKGVVVGALVTAFVGLIAVGMSAGIFVIGRTVIEKNNVTVQETQAADTDSLDFNKIGNKMSRIQRVISEYYLFEEDMEKVEDGIYQGLMYGLEDPYSVYYNEKDFQALMETTEGVYCGIGVMVSQNRLTGLITVIKVFEGTPGFEAGIQPGDVLYKVGDTEVSGMDLDIVVSKHIKGKENTPVTITVAREGEEDYVEMTMNREMIEVPTISHQMLDNQVGYINVSQFDVVTAEQFVKAVDDLTNKNMEKLVIDLRSNPGGVLDSAVSMLDYLLADDLTEYSKEDGKTLIIYTADKNGEGDVYSAGDGHKLAEEIPVAILVNGDSASASEIFAGAMKDYGRGIIVGTTTFGKGIVQNLIPLGDNTAIKLTTSNYYTPAGINIHGKGIEPDVEVELTEELQKKAVVTLEEDNQLKAAIEALEGKEAAPAGAETEAETESAAE